MRYYKVVDGEYILQVGTGRGGTKIEEEEYNTILSTFSSRPKPEESYDFRLKTDLTWERFELQPDPDPDVDVAEALAILLGGAE